MSNRGGFTLTGDIEKKNGKWQAWIQLNTPDGKSTLIESGFIYSDAALAKTNLEAQLSHILAEFSKDGVEVVSKNGVSYS